MLAKMSSSIIKQSFDEFRGDKIVSDTSQDTANEMTSKLKPFYSGKLSINLKPYTFRRNL